MTTTPNFRDDIQGLRAIAVLLVVVYHSGLDFLPGGFIGVDVFFVISGYLIAGALTREITHSGSIDLFNFYARRARRLLPAAVLVILITIIVWRFIYSPLELYMFSSSAIATSLYLSNFWFAHLATDYLADHSNPNPLLHTWSLSVEEQFYLIWPFILLIFYKLATPAHRTMVIFWGTIGASIVSFVACIKLTTYAQPWAFFVCFTRFWEFGLGALCAIYRGKSMNTARPIANFCTTLGLALILFSGFQFSATTAFPGFAAILPVLGTALLLVYVSSNVTPFYFRLLANRFCKFLGNISYSLYLWHWPVFVLLGELGLNETFPWHLCGIFASVVLAQITYMFVENPIRFSKIFTASAARAYGLGFCLTVLCLAAGYIVRAESKAGLERPAQKLLYQIKTTIPKIYDDDCHYQFLDVQLKDCKYGNPSSEELVVLFGDSHAAHWFPAAEEIARERGFLLIPFTKSSCPSIIFEPYNKKFGRPYTECSKWRAAAIERIITLKPHTILISNSYGYSETDNVTDFEWAKSLSSLLDKLSPYVAKIVVIHDVPRIPFNVPTCLSRADWLDKDPLSSCRFSKLDPVRKAFIRQERNVVRKYPNVTSIDFTESICPSNDCEVIQDDIVLYSDSNHISVELSKKLGDTLNKMVW